MPKNNKGNARIRLFNNTSWFTEEGQLDWRQIVRKTILIALTFLFIYAIALYFVQDHYHVIGAWTIENLGYAGVALLVFLIDTFIVPMSVDIIFPFVLEWNPVTLLATMSLASAAGGFCGYWIGRLLGHLPLIKAFTSRFSEDGERLINKYGVWAVVIAGLTPIPFSTVCWMAGMFRVQWQLVALATLSRIPRMILYYLFFRGGLIFVF